MWENAQSTNLRPFESAKRKQLNAKQSCRVTQKLCESGNADVYNYNDSGSTADCTSHLLQSINTPRCHRLLEEKLARQRRSNAKKRKSCLQKRRVESVRRATVPITPQMIRVAVKELQTRRVYISSALIASHLRRFYPIENHPDALKKELNQKLDCAVSVGLIAKCGEDKYCIPTLRQQASLNKTALTAFWDTYYKKEPPATMEQLFTLGIPELRAYKKRRSIAQNRSYSSESDNYQNLDELDS